MPGTKSSGPHVTLHAPDSSPVAADAGVTSAPEASRLLPHAVAKWVVGGLVVMMGLAFYLVAVRGTAILFDLSDAVGAICF